MSVVNKWIKCSDQLPEDNQLCWVVVKLAFDCHDIDLCTWDEYHTCWNDEDDDDYGYDNESVLYWQPHVKPDLPEELKQTSEQPHEQRKTRIAVDFVKNLIAQRRAINALPLREIVWVLPDGGEVEPASFTIEQFEETGLSNLDFLEYLPAWKDYKCD